MQCFCDGVLFTLLVGWFHSVGCLVWWESLGVGVFGGAGEYCSAMEVSAAPVGAGISFSGRDVFDV
jgi:hypothetical protein